MRDLLDIDNNRELLALLKAKKQTLIPFIGAGFSIPYCPTWETFLKGFFDDLTKQKLLLPQQIQEYHTLTQLTAANRLELMADFLCAHGHHLGFKDQIKKQFDPTRVNIQTGKFHLLHRAFPYLKITTNYDSLIEDLRPPDFIHTDVIAYGYQPDKMELYFTQRFETQSLVKLHGDIRDSQAIVLSSEQYATIYGNIQRYNLQFPLPKFLQRLFRDSFVLFIGCSLHTDRTMAILEDLTDKQEHFAIMRLPQEPEKRTRLKQRLLKLGVRPFWVEEFSQIEEVLTLLSDRPMVAAKPFTPTPGFFVGRQRELELMETHMTPGSIQAITGRFYSIHGAGGVGKTTLALEAAQRFKTKFKDGVIGPIRVDDFSPPAFAVTLANLLGERIQEPRQNQEAQQMVTALLKERCCLLILDNASTWDNVRYMLPLQTCATILVTTRDRDMAERLRLNCHGIPVAEIPLDIFSESEALALFKELLGPRYLVAEEEQYLLIAAALGFLPLALRQVVTLMVYTPHYQAAELRQKLEREGRLQVLQKGHEAGDSDSRAIETVFDLASPLLTKDLQRVLEYLAVCSPGPVPLDFLERLMAGKETDSREKLEQLYTYSWCERRVLPGETERYYQLHQLVRELLLPRVAAQRRQDFIGLVHTLFMDEAVHFSLKDRYYPQLEEAFEQAVAQKDPQLKKWVYDLYDFCSYRGYGHFFVSLTRRVEELFADDQWILRAAYANRAVILYNWGQLDEALSLYKKQEEICDVLGDRAGLSRSYCGQGLIYKAKGQLDEALSLYKKDEEICDVLGYRAGLSASYGNQGIIYFEKGQLEESMRLLKKQEHICEELGDRTGLAISWWNQGEIHEKQGDAHTQAQLWQKAIETSKDMGMPYEEWEKKLKVLLEKEEKTN